MPKNGRRKKKHPKYFISEFLRNLYKHLDLPPIDKKSKLIWQTRPAPINFEKATKAFTEKGGIDLSLYEHHRFRMSEKKFYRMLFPRIINDRTDTELLFFLEDFSKLFSVQVKENLGKKYDLIIPKFTKKELELY